jgi:hypothetical protein
VIDFQLGQQYTVSMSAFSQAVCDGGLTNCYSDQAEGTAAFVDPTFTLDPSVLNPNQYTVLFSPNILLAAGTRAVDLGNAASRLRGHWLHGLSPEVKARIDGRLISDHQD